MTTYIIGDLHGHIDQYRRLLRSSALCDEDLNWCGGTDSLWLIGDFFDRGESGIACMDLTMELQRQAGECGGQVEALLGNHEFMMLCAHQFQGDRLASSVPVLDVWRSWGGVSQDLEMFSERHREFIVSLPAMARVGDNLLVHADAMLYVNHGVSIDMVNDSFRTLMLQPDLEQWMMLLSGFAEHMAFSELPLTGTQRAAQLLQLYGGAKLVHGHTPIPIARGDEPESVISAWEYADGLCINVDGGIYMGSPGFVYQLAE